ncbi:restriction endonuclease subunit S [Streptococcus mitis]|uniref:restriction endonuclease subunit S n=1 Tax=Streptococcus mitis TaxID=28037 RepID=UPI0021B81D3F|nr:restriction endonuclease subunit S [Streptococcus mitis]
MNILEEIQNCPVEWKELGEVVEVLDSLRRPITKSQRIPGDIPYYGANGIQDYVKDWIFDGTFILMGEDGSVIKNDNSPILHWVIGKIWVNNHAHILGEVPGCALLKYVYYVLSQTDVSDIVRGTPPKLNQKNLKSIKIPIPPLEIQEKIVQILDKFTDYVTELTSELTSRKKQYSFYRDKLLSFEDEVYRVEWKTIQDISVKIVTGVTPKKSCEDYYLKGTIPWLRTNEVKFNTITTTEKYVTEKAVEETGLKWILPNSIIIAISGATAGRVAMNSIPLTTNQHCCSISVDERIVNYKYLYYWLVNQNRQILSLKQGARGDINMSMIKSLKIPVPSLEIQSRIVQVLDNFDTVCNDLNIGLPKEIELRQKQYEYFREKLLTFVAEGEYTESRVEEWDNSAIIKLLQWVFGPIRVELGAIGDIIRGNGLQKKDFQDAGVPCIHYGQIYTYYGIETEVAKSFVNIELSQKLKKAKNGDLIVATTSENIEDVGKALVWHGKDEVCIGGHSCVIRTEQNSKYLAYFFRTSYFQNQKKKSVLGTKVIELYPKNLAKIQIILPSLSTQSQIVTVLDNFNTLTDSLSEGLPKEIELRQKQYDYWREQLLNFTR